MMPVIRILAWREIIRFFRQPHRVVGSLAQPLLIWLFLGSGFSASFRVPGTGNLSYAEYFYPGVLLMLLLFAGIFSTITVVEDRQFGLLQGILVSPTPRMSIVLGKVLGSMGVALIQSVPILALAPLMDLTPAFGNILLILLGCLLATLGFTAMGFMIAWRMESTAGFHAIMSVFLMPMWMLSGAIFPVDHAPTWLWMLMMLNPATHALQLIRMPFYAPMNTLLASPDYRIALATSLAWGGICLMIALFQVNRVDVGGVR